MCFWAALFFQGWMSQIDEGDQYLQWVTIAVYVVSIYVDILLLSLTSENTIIGFIFQGHCGYCFIVD